MRDLVETTTTYLMALGVLVATYYAASSWLSGLVEQAFSNLAIATR